MKAIFVVYKHAYRGLAKGTIKDSVTINITTGKVVSISPMSFDQEVFPYNNVKPPSEWKLNDLRYFTKCYTEQSHPELFL
jgi:hypothetical protein